MPELFFLHYYKYFNELIVKTFIYWIRQPHIQKRVYIIFMISKVLMTSDQVSCALRLKKLMKIAQIVKTSVPSREPENALNLTLDQYFFPNLKKLMKNCKKEWNWTTRSDASISIIFSNLKKQTRNHESKVKLQTFIMEIQYDWLRSNSAGSIFRTSTIWC